MTSAQRIGAYISGKGGETIAAHLSTIISFIPLELVSKELLSLLL
jgi:hypothetical protein